MWTTRRSSMRSRIICPPMRRWRCSVGSVPRRLGCPDSEERKSITVDGTYSVSLVALENAVIHADEIGAGIGRLLDELEGNVSAKLASWTGEAQRSYQACKARWDAAASQMPQTLAAARATLEAIAEQYDAAEKAAIDTFFGGIH